MEREREIARNYMKIPKQYRHEHVSCLPIELEHEVMKEVKKAIDTLLLTDEEKQNAIESADCEKLCNLTDTIEIEFV